MSQRCSSCFESLSRDFESNYLGHETEHRLRRTLDPTLTEYDAPVYDCPGMRVIHRTFTENYYDDGEEDGNTLPDLP